MWMPGSPRGQAGQNHERTWRLLLIPVEKGTSQSQVEPLLSASG
jgi:hypothetical protein